MTNNSRTGSAGATSSQNQPRGGACVTIQISPVVEREFKRRDVFPELRLEDAVRIQNGATGVYKVSIERAEALMADARVMRTHDRELPRGTLVAYGALARNIQHSLQEEERQGLWKDPGVDEAEQRAAASPARFEVGDSVLYFENDDDEYGEEVAIVNGYGMYRCSSRDGAYINDQGERADYRRCYGVAFKDSGDSRFYALAHQLTRADCKPSYLRLVTEVSPRPFLAGGAQ